MGYFATFGMMWDSLALCFILITCDFAVSQTFKRWKPSTNYEVASNWDSGEMPCSRDRVVFPSSSPPIFIQTNTTLAEMVLPRDGELVLGDYASIAFPAGSAQDNNCPGTEVKFNHTEPDSWFDAAQWCVTSDAEGDCSATQPRVLDSERLPCRFDTAVFPVGHSFLVSLESGVDVYIRSLTIYGQSHSTGSFRRYLDTPEGRKQFRRAADGPVTTINIKDESCSDRSGCACGNDQSPILDKICESVLCEDVQCDKAFIPIGGCCRTCGAVLDLDYTNDFRITSLKNMIERNYLKNEKRRDDFNETQFIVSKTSLDHIQVLLIDSSDGEEASSLGRALSADLKADMSGNRRYGVSHVTLKTTGSLEPQERKSDQGRRGLGSGPIVGIVIVIFLISLAIIVIVALVRLRRQHRRPSDFLPKLPSFKSSFKRFNRFKMRNEEMNGFDVGPSIGYNDPTTMSDVAEGFDNPMYAEPGEAAGAPEPIDLPHVIDTTNMANEHSNGFTNPLYAEGPVELTHGDHGVSSMVKFNPVFTTEGIEDDSEI